MMGFALRVVVLPTACDGGIALNVELMASRGTSSLEGGGGRVGSRLRLRVGFKIRFKVTSGSVSECGSQGSVSEAGCFAGISL